MHKGDLIYPLIIAVFVVVLTHFWPALFYQPPVKSDGIQVGIYTATFVLIWIAFLFLIVLTVVGFVQYASSFFYMPNVAKVKSLLEGALKGDKAVVGYEKDPNISQWEVFCGEFIRFSPFLNRVRTKCPRGKYDRLTQQLVFTKEELKTIQSLLSEIEDHSRKKEK